jgi:diaminopimelate epimerase
LKYMPLHFTKMQALGNDFVIIDGVRQQVALSAEQIRWMSARRTGIGCDQLLVAENGNGQDEDFGVRIYNADGSEAEQCGNGIRCVARFVQNQALTSKTSIALRVSGALYRLTVHDDDRVTADMGIPEFEPDRVPFVADRRCASYSLELNGQSFSMAVLSMGNPHAVQFVDDVEVAPVATIGPLIEHHRRFPKRTNVEFVQVVDRSRVHLRVYERGVGETQACGSGACAAVVAAHQAGLVTDAVQVTLEGGDLEIEWAGGDTPVYMTGPASTVFDGTLELR